MAITRILYLAAIFWLAVNGNVNWKAKINPVTSKSIPAGDGLVNTYHVRWQECPFAVIIKIFDKVVHKHPLICSWTNRMRSNWWLVAEAKAVP